jgi:microcystin-dependent protein
MKTSTLGALAVAAALAAPAQAQSPQDCFLGEVRMFAGNYEPENWRFTDGRLLPIVDNQGLFAILGTTFGGNGQTNFALPDLRGRFPLGFGPGPGLTERTLGEAAGTETVTQTVNEMAPHSHAARASSAAATHIRPQGRLLAKVEPTTAADVYGPPPADVPMAPEAIGPSGGGQPQANMPPYLAMNFIVCVQGTFPVRWPN